MTWTFWLGVMGIAIGILLLAEILFPDAWRKQPKGDEYINRGNNFGTMGPIRNEERMRDL